MHRFFVFCFSLMFCVIVSGQICPAASPAETPESAVADIQTAIDKADLPRFERRVDVDGLSSQGSALFIDMLRKTGENKSASLPPALALMGSAVQSPETATALRGMLSGEVAAFVRDGIESGRFGGKAKNAKTSTGGRGTLAPLLADVSTGRKSLRLVGKVTAAKDGGGAVEAPIAVRDAGNGKEYRVRLWMEKTGGIWRVKRIADLPDIAAALWQEATAPK